MSTDVMIFDTYFRLELWPGYTTSILQYETDILLSADVSHKVLRQSTVLDYLYELYNTKKDFYNEATKRVVGQIVLTRYWSWVILWRPFVTLHDAATSLRNSLLAGYIVTSESPFACRIISFKSSVHIQAIVSGFLLFALIFCHCEYMCKFSKGLPEGYCC